MTITATEKFGGVRASLTTIGKTSSASRTYVCRTDDPANDLEAEIAQHVYDNTPDNWEGLPRTTITVLQQLCNNEDVSLSPEAFYEVEVLYSDESSDSQSSKPLNENPLTVEQPVRITIRNAGKGTRTMYKSLKLLDEQANEIEWKFLAAAATDDAKKEFVNLLGIKPSPAGSGTLFTVEGYDVEIGTVELIVETLRRDADVQLGALVTLASAAAQNTVNSTDWRGWPAGTLRMTSFSASQRGGAIAAGSPTPPWEVNFTFLYEPNIAVGPQTEPDPPDDPDDPYYTHPLKIGDLPPMAVGKKGHELLDITIAPEKANLNPTSTPANDAFFMVGKPVRAAIHQIYPELNFSTDLNL